jgi:Flp pilus assembly protein TadG
MSGINTKAQWIFGLRRLPRGFKRGQSAVELALLSPVLALLLLVVVDLGRLFYLSIEVNSGARAGVQYGAQNSGTAVDNAGMVQAAKQDAADIGGTWWGTATNFTATAKHFCQCADGSASSCGSGACGGGQQYTLVEVDTTASCKPMFSYVGLPATITLKGKAVMRASNG